MRTIKAYILISITALALSATALAEMPKELKGTWVLDVDATVKQMKTSPGGNDQARKRFTEIVKRMSQVMFEFTNDSLVLSIGETMRTLTVASKNNQANVSVFEGKAGEEPFTLAVSVANETNINFRSSLNNDLDSCLWKRRGVSESAALSAVNRSIMPEFSWDTLPLYMHIRKSYVFSKKELQFLSEFPLITLEKTTGSKSFGSTDAGTIEMAKRIKKLNPKAKVLFYRNVICHYGGYTFNEQIDSIPNWFLVGKDGQPSTVRGRIKAYDTTNPALRDWWVSNAKKVCDSPYIDGLFIDGNVKVLMRSYMLRQLPAGKKKATIEGYHEMMAQTRDALGPNKLMFANIIRAHHFENGGLEYMDKLDGSYLENFLSPNPDLLAKGIDTVQKAARMGKIIAMTLSIGATAVSEGVDEVPLKNDDLNYGSKEIIDFNIALFLVCAEKYSYLYIKDGYSAETRRGICESRVWMKALPEYKKPLGPPKGPAKRDGYIYTREFEHVSVWLDIEKRKGRVTWKNQ